MNKLLGILPFLLAIGGSANCIRGGDASRRLTNEVLFAKYDWQDGAEDVSDSPVRHDGVLDNGITAADGKLSVHTGYGVDLGVVPELDGASEVLFRFEDVSITDLPDGASSQYSVLLGGGDSKWWVGVDIDLPNGPTYLVLNVGGWSGPAGLAFDYKVKVDDGVLAEFDSIEYRFNGNEVDTGKRLAIRYNDGGWIEGGWSTDDFSDPNVFRAFPTSMINLKINDGWRSDWDDWTGSVGTVSLSASPPSAYFNVYEGVCRVNADGTGNGSNRVQYDLFKRVDNPNVDYEWCKNECISKSECTGFEYRDSWDTSQCEVWHKPILGFEEKPDHFCLVKLDRNHSYNENLGVCRNQAGGQGKNGNEYNLYKRVNIPAVDYQWCIDKCSEDRTCTGIEHRWSPEADQQCEIWHAVIGSVVNMPNSNCNMKVYV
jgi:hypothetical protein